MVEAINCSGHNMQQRKWWLFDQQSEVGGNAYFGVMINNAYNTA